MNSHLLCRREFNARCAAFGLALPAASAPMTVFSGTSAIAAEKSISSATAERTVKFSNGAVVPAVGQGSWHLGQGRHPADVEQEALRVGHSLGMTLIDTSGNYGNGLSEQLIGRAIAGLRDRVFLVSKVEPHEVAGDGMTRACEASLARLGTDHLDLYLMHFPVPSDQLAAVVAGFERLRAAGKIGAWGVSNFTVRQMEDLMRVPDGHRCATNQIPYSLNNRSVERLLLPWCREHGIPIMAYSPLGGSGNLVIGNRLLAQIGEAHGSSAAAVALAWVIRNGDVIAIPESGAPAHVKENAAALSLTLTPQELQALDTAYPAPSGLQFWKSHWR